jgi:hypothetical protein
MNTQNLLYINLGINLLLVLCCAWIFYKLFRLDQVRKHFFSSGIKKDLEQVLVDQNRTLTSAVSNIENIEHVIAQMKDLNRYNIQKIGLVRFNPFDRAGGNMSFCLALLNDHGEGVVVSSLHNREGTRIYSKPISNFQSEIKLTAEEQQAIKEAK